MLHCCVRWGLPRLLAAFPSLCRAVHDCDKAGVCPGSSSRPALFFATLLRRRAGACPGSFRGLGFPLPKVFVFCTLLGLAPATSASPPRVFPPAHWRAGACPTGACIKLGRQCTLHVRQFSAWNMALSPHHMKNHEISVCRWQDFVKQGLINAPAPPPSHAASPAAPRAQPHCRATGATAAALSATLF